MFADGLVVKPIRDVRRGMLRLSVALLGVVLLSGCSVATYCTRCPDPQPKTYRKTAETFVRALDLKAAEVRIAPGQGVLCNCPYAKVDYGYVEDPAEFIGRAIKAAQARGFTRIAQRPRPAVPGADEYKVVLRKGDIRLLFLWDDDLDAQIAVEEWRSLGRD